MPASQDPDPNDDRHSQLLFSYRLKISSSAPAPAVLTDGLVAVRPITAAAAPEAAAPGAGGASGAGVERLAAAELPRNVAPGERLDVDATDNDDEFAVYVAPAGDTGDDADDDADDDDQQYDGLPITGTRTGRTVVVGAALTILGALLLLATRRIPEIPNT